MLNNLNFQQRLLADFMSGVSERCWNAGWMKNLEYVLWDAIINGDCKYGHDFIDQNDIKVMRGLSVKANCWIIFDEEREETSINLDVWARKFQYDIQQNPDFLKG